MKIKNDVYQAILPLLADTPKEENEVWHCVYEAIRNSVHLIDLVYRDLGDKKHG